MKRSKLLEAQIELKKRVTNEKTAKNSIRSLGLPSKRRPLSSAWVDTRRIAGIAGGRENNRSLRTEAASRGEKLRKYIRARKDFISEVIEIEDQFVSNIPEGEQVPPIDVPWIYYMFSTVILTTAKETLRVRDVITLYGETQEQVNDALLELITRPGVKMERDLSI